MSKQITGKDKENFKEKTIKEITLQLTEALPALKVSLGEKKFEKRVKKAAKLLADGIKEKATSNEPTTKISAAKKKTKKVKTAIPAKKTVKAAISK